MSTLGCSCGCGMALNVRMMSRGHVCKEVLVWGGWC
jgi:hypothetical protein